jgi:hypothetical protein
LDEVAEKEKEFVEQLVWGLSVLGALVVSLCLNDYLLTSENVLKLVKSHHIRPLGNQSSIPRRRNAAVVTVTDSALEPKRKVMQSPLLITRRGETFIGPYLYWQRK